MATTTPIGHTAGAGTVDRTAAMDPVRAALLGAGAGVLGGSSSG